MKSMFDLDCPTTPDDGGDGDKNNNKAPPTSRGVPKPPTSSRPPRSSASSTPRSSRMKSYTPRTSRKSFSPRARSSSRKSTSTNVGLEPEEYIAPPPPPPAAIMRSPMYGRSPMMNNRMMSRQAPGSGNGATLDTIGADAGGNRRRAHSTDAFGDTNNHSNNHNNNCNNPFGTTDETNEDNINGGGNNNSSNNNNHRRSNSGNWWREEIVDEGQDKGETMDEYYGLNPSEKQELYGRGPTPSASAHQPSRGNGPNPFDVEEGSSDSQIPSNHTMHNHPSAATTQNNGTSNLNSDIYQHATASNNAGGIVDDYSFSNVNLSSPSQVVGSPGMNNRMGYHPTTPNNNNARDQRNNKGSAPILKWLGNALSSGKKDHYEHPHLPPNMTLDTNIAPRSPQVTFTNDFHPSGIIADKRKGSGYWNRLSPAQKVGMAVIWVAFLCTIFGVTISELRKTNAQVPTSADGSGDGDGSQAWGFGVGQGQGQGVPQLAPPAPDGGDTPAPTPWPEETPEPTSEPTTRSPTRQPVTSSPVAGYYAVHGKQSDGTSHPTRSPVTAIPTTPPTTSSPTTKEPTTTEPSSASPSVSIQAVQSASAPAAGNTVPSATVSCTDKSGFFTNHLLNLKNCAWLDNGKSGTTDRKTKNCGGTIVEEDGSTASYPTTELGTMCPYTCGLYNGCDGIVASMSVVQSTQNNNNARDTNDNEDNECSDENGEFKNHLLNPKTCEWLDNDKDGHTDRKDKNCGGRPVVDEFTGGTVVYPTTELGNKCRKTCGLYNGCGASGAAMMAMSAINGSSKEKPSCHDLDGTFVNHLANPKTCEWLFNDKPGQTDRKDKNCGYANYPVTLLGLACPKTCSWYNNDSGCDEVLGKISVSNGNFMRSFSSPNYSFSMSSLITTASSSNTCTDGSEEYLDHKHVLQACIWLRGNGHADGNVGRHRQEKNCGSSSHAITELGRECPYTCREYNDCGS